MVYVNNLTGLTASDNATVSTFGKLSLLSLNVKLQNNATASLNVNAVTLNSNVSGTRNLVLEGSANDLNAKIASLQRQKKGDKTLCKIFRRLNVIHSKLQQAFSF